jgi:hypothetical protein
MGRGTFQPIAIGAAVSTLFPTNGVVPQRLKRFVRCRHYLGAEHARCSRTPRSSDRNRDMITPAGAGANRASGPHGGELQGSGESKRSRWVFFNDLLAS